MSSNKSVTNRNPKPRVPGRVEMGQYGWGVRLWHDADPIITNLASKSEAFKLLYALRYGWSSVTLKWFSGHTMRVNLQPYWHRRTHPAGISGDANTSTSGNQSSTSKRSGSGTARQTSGRLVKPWPNETGAHS